MKEDRGRLESLGAWLGDHWPHLGVWVFGVLLAVAAPLSTDEAERHLCLPHWVEGFAVVVLLAAPLPLAVLLIVQHFFDRANERDLRGLRAENSALQAANAALEDRLSTDGARWTEQVRNLLNGYLLGVAQHRLHFGTSGRHEERISLYLHDGEDAFHMVARFSANPVYNQAGRTRHAERAGVIGQAWQHGSHFVGDFPDYASDPSAYLKRHTQSGIKRADAQALRMKSRLYYGHRIESEVMRPLAVMVVEAVDPGRFTELELRTAFDDDYAIGRLLQHLAEYIPSPANAAELGL